MVYFIRFVRISGGSSWEFQGERSDKYFETSQKSFNRFPTGRYKIIFYHHKRRDNLFYITVIIRWAKNRVNKKCFRLLAWEGRVKIITNKEPKSKDGDEIVHYYSIYTKPVKTFITAGNILYRYDSTNQNLVLCFRYFFATVEVGWNSSNLL